ncbi:MAG: hypothetical protein M0P70_05970 [Desulfobulbaceae bacterium]|nr:hypothetical protein [Desulfobulbaceae bacterium]
MGLNIRILIASWRVMAVPSCLDMSFPGLIVFNKLIGICQGNLILYAFGGFTGKRSWAMEKYPVGMGRIPE